MALYLALEQNVPAASTSRPRASALELEFLSSPSENSSSSSNLRASAAGSVSTPPAPILHTLPPAVVPGTKPSALLPREVAAGFPRAQGCGPCPSKRTGPMGAWLRPGHATLQGPAGAGP